MKLLKSVGAAGAIALLALAIPGGAAAVPGVYSVVAKTGNDGVTFLTDPTGAALTNTETQYTVSADGYTLGFSEDNGVTGDGVIDYKVLPSEYRAPMSAEEKRVYGPAQTDLQAHATCSGVAELGGPTILAWQEADPSYNYVPWQKTSAGLGDDPVDWIPVVKTATGVDLSALSTVQAFTDACTGLGGTYHPADSSTALADKLIANAVTPLQKEIASLKDKVSSLTKAKSDVDKSLATEKDLRKAAEVGYQEQYNRPVSITLAAKRSPVAGGVAVLVTGSVNDPVTVTLSLTKKQAKSLGIKDPVLAETTVFINAQGAAIATLKPVKSDAKKLAKRKAGVKVKVLGESGILTDSESATLKG